MERPKQRSQGVEGIELLEAYERGEIVVDDDGEVRWVDDESDENDLKDVDEEFDYGDDISEEEELEKCRI